MNAVIDTSMNTPTWSLEGRTAVVVGGARMLGWDACRALAGLGARVALTSRDNAGARVAASRLAGEFGVETLGLGVDVRDEESLDRAAQEIAAWSDRLDVLVSNVGGGSGEASGDLFERPVEVIREMIDVNLTGSLLACRAFGRVMRDRGHGGSVITVGSIAGLVGRDRRMYAEGGVEPQPIDYAAAKSGVIGMSRDLAAAWAPLGIRVNSISPGGFGPRELPDAFVENYSDRTPLARMGRDGQDLGGAVAFLASDASAYVTGHNLVVDGGFTAWR